MNEIYVLCDIGMNFQIIILFFVTAIIIERALTNLCGKTTSLQYGNTATITFTPDSRSVAYSRTWIHRLPGNSIPEVVFNSSGTASRPTRYNEELLSSGTYILKIHNVTINDSGLYNVRCYFEGAKIIYSETTTLKITREHDTTEVENPTLSQPINETTKTKNAQKFDDNSACENKENHSAKDKSMVTGIAIGVAVGIVATLAVVLAILLICKHRKSPNSVYITNSANHTMEVMTVASTRNESSDSNSGYLSLHPTSRSNNEQEYADLMTSQPHQDYEIQERESARYINII